MNKRNKNKEETLNKASVVTTAKVLPGQDFSKFWPELGNIGVVVGDIAAPQMEETEASGYGLSATLIKTGGIFVDMPDQQIWPIRYSSDSVDVQEYVPELGFRKKRK